MSEEPKRDDGEEPLLDIEISEWRDRSDTDRRKASRGIRNAPFFSGFLDRRKSPERRSSSSRDSKLRP